jgi:dihydrofolate reductase
MINCIVAVDKSHGIGFKGHMPWPHLKGDMSWFRQMTTNQVVIMGSTTWKSLGYKPLPNRINIVLSRTHDYSGENAADHTFSDPDTALVFCENEYPDKEIFIIGGDVVYRTYLDIVDRFYVTEIDADFECDRHFDLSYVQKNFTKVKECATFTDPIKYIIKEYNI